MKKLLLPLVLIFVTSDLTAQSLKVRVDSLTETINKSDTKIENVAQSVAELSKQVTHLSYLNETQKDIISQEQSAIENSLNSVNILLAFSSILIAVGGIVLGWFINRKEKNINNLLQEVVRLEQQTVKTKTEIQQLNETINSDIEGLYQKLRKEETASIFKRLVDVPLDIANVDTLLLAREVDPNNFRYLITAYRKFKNIESDDISPLIVGLPISERYLLQFFQHFCGQAISHDLTRADLIDFFSTALECAFLSDVEYSTNSLIICLNKEKSLDSSNILFKYIKALSESRHGKQPAIYEIIVNKYHNDSELTLIWEKLVANNVIIKPFGELLCNRFSENETFVNSVKKLFKSTQQNRKVNE